MSSPSTAGSAHVEWRRHARILRSSLAADSSQGRAANAPPSSLRGLWPGEATLLAAAVLWLLVLLYVGAHAWGAMVNDSRTDVGEIGER